LRKKVNGVILGDCGDDGVLSHLGGKLAKKSVINCWKEVIDDFLK
jgi:hypothetical protein